jgi:hypothetical protein
VGYHQKARALTQLRVTPAAQFLFPDYLLDTCFVPMKPYKWLTFAPALNDIV